MPSTKAYRAALLHCLADPREVGIEQAHEYFEDGLLVVEDGSRAHRPRRRTAADPGGRHRCRIPGRADHSGFRRHPYPLPAGRRHRLLRRAAAGLAGNLHLPQRGAASATWPTPAQAELFLGELLRTAPPPRWCSARCTSSRWTPSSRPAKRNLRMIAGKGADGPQRPGVPHRHRRVRLRRQPRADRALARQGPSAYAVTPRFAPTSTPEQLTLAGKLFAEFPDLYMHTHISENKQGGRVGQAVPRAQGLRTSMTTTA